MTSGKWKSSDRRQHLPANWRALRLEVADRAHWICEWVEAGQRCSAKGSECDHIGDRDDHRIEMLRWLCSAHHQADTQRRAQEARRKYAEPLRAPEAHPGRRQRR